MLNGVDVAQSDSTGPAALVAAVASIGAADSPHAALLQTADVARGVIHDAAVIVCARPMAGELVSALVGLDAGGGDPLAQLSIPGGGRSVVSGAEGTLLPQLGAEKVALLCTTAGVAPSATVVLARPLEAGEFTDADEAMARALAEQASLVVRALTFGDERRGLEEQLRHAERLKTEFVAMTSHELRTPLTSIRAATSMVRSYWDTIADDRKHRLLEVIEGQAQRLSRLVENILAAANIEAGVVLPRIMTVDLAVAADEVARDFAAELDVVVDVERPLTTEADPDHVRQILVNFVGNSLKYGDQPITITGRRNGQSIELRVSDEGPGVPEAFVPRLWERFTQASSGDSRRASGSGLGLSIVKGLAEASGGGVHYEPNEPKGSCFVLTLPA